MDILILFKESCSHIYDFGKFILSAGVVSAGLTLFFNWLLEYRRNKRERIAFLNALHSEVKAMLALIGVRKEEFTQFYNNDIKNYSFVYFPVSYNYCVVYETNANKIGILKNKDLVHCIICTYTDLKGLFENIKDLENISKMAYNYVVEHPGDERNSYFVSLHSNYCQHIINKQVPLVEDALQLLLKRIETETIAYEKEWFFYGLFK